MRRRRGEGERLHRKKQQFMLLRSRRESRRNIFGRLVFARCRILFVWTQNIISVTSYSNNMPTPKHFWENQKCVKNEQLAGDFRPPLSLFCVLLGWVVIGVWMCDILHASQAKQATYAGLRSSHRHEYLNYVADAHTYANVVGERDRERSLTTQTGRPTNKTRQTDRQ